MNIPFLTKWLKKQEAKENIEKFVQLQQRQAVILRLRRAIEQSK
jgi:competence CoiA-like predicted nuclease